MNSEIETNIRGQPSLSPEPVGESLPILGTIIELSTAHFSVADRDVLARLADDDWIEVPLRVLAYPEGFFVWVLGDEPITPQSFGVLSPQFAEVLAELFTCGCRYLRFDADAPILRGLPCFDW